LKPAALTSMAVQEGPSTTNASTNAVKGAFP